MGTPAAPPVRRSLALRALRFGRRQAAAVATAGAVALARARGDREAAARAKLRALALTDPTAALVQVARVRRRRDSRFLAEAEALLTIQVRGWAAAARFRLPPGAPTGALELFRPSPGLGLDLALPACRTSVPPGAVLYTARFGDSPSPAPLLDPVPVRCLLMTDRAPDVPGWETLRVMPDPDPARAMLAARIRGPELLAGIAEASLFLDPALRPVGSLNALLRRWLAPQDLALWRHPRAQGWREVIADALFAAPDPSALVALAEACEAEGLPDAGACDTRALWRRHSPGLQALTEAWWVRATPGTADAAFAAALAATGIRPRILPASLGALDNGIFTAHAPWPAPAWAPARPGRLPLAFLYPEEFATTASTFLRMGQLAELVAEHDDRYDIAWTSDFEGTCDRIVLLGKGVLQTREAEEIAALRARNIALIGSWDDLRPDAGRVAALDANMALSWTGMLDLARRYPATPAFHVRHHVNRLIKPGSPPMDRLRTGYFGELANTVRPDALGSMVEFVGINTSRVDTTWIDRLPEFNAHWIVRNKRPFDGAKPFLKGFLAARCGAVAIASREDEDALHYLGEDYPFFVTSLEPGDLEADVVRIATGFGGVDWRLAQAIMAEVSARSTDAVVAAEFCAMIEALTA